MNWETVKDRFDPAAFHFNALPEVKWIMEHLTGNECLVLDVGCLDSGLMDMMQPECCAIGIDIRKATGSRHVVRGDIRTVQFSGAMFDAIVFLSTIEHIGLDCYGNKAMSRRGDSEALLACEDILTPDGKVLITMPYHPESAGRHRGGVLWERRYCYETAMSSLVAPSSLTLMEYTERREDEIICMELVRKAYDTEDKRPVQVGGLLPDHRLFGHSFEGRQTAGSRMEGVPV